ncbi:MAG: SH3 domain-containing protein [bacterium]|nr:SH3 domain-containing protein [bacterium]
MKGTVVNVRQGPGTTYPVLFQAEKGEAFSLVRTEGLWCLITLDQGREAWVFGKLVDVLPGQRSGSPNTEEAEPGEKDEPVSMAGKVAGFIFLLLFLTSSAVAVWKREQLLRFVGRKLKEIAGYRREQPFRYDNRKPSDDSWEL